MLNYAEIYEMFLIQTGVKNFLSSKGVCVCMSVCYVALGSLLRKVKIRDTEKFHIKGSLFMFICFFLCCLWVK